REDVLPRQLVQLPAGLAVDVADLDPAPPARPGLPGRPMGGRGGDQNGLAVLGGGAGPLWVCGWDGGRLTPARRAPRDQRGPAGRGERQGRELEEGEWAATAPGQTAALRQELAQAKAEVAELRAGKGK